MRKRIEHIKKTETGRSLLTRFLLVLTIFLLYAFYVVEKFGAEKGLFVAFLTWAFFVLSTPIADAGLLLAFPIRLLAGIRMVKVQVFAYLIAIALTAWAFFYTPNIFQSTLLLRLFHEILTHPWPYWLIFLISAIGTFASIIFADELMDVVSHKQRKHFHRHGWKYELILTAGLIGLSLIFYKMLLDELGVDIPL